MTGEKMRSPTDDPEQDSLWVSASQRGDATAFNRLVLKWEKNIYNIALRMLRKPEEAAEATQEVFLLAFKNIRRFRHDSKFSTWLYRIVINHCLTCASQRPPGIHLPLDAPNAATMAVQRLPVTGTPDVAVTGTVTRTPEVELLRSEQEKLVSAALMHLPPEQQAVIELKFFQEMTFEEIAAVLDVPLSTIKSRLYTGLEVLKVRLGNGFLAGRRE
jgi:RNA polymerase sigma-70 factor, ECF subfamily